MSKKSFNFTFRETGPSGVDEYAVISREYGAPKGLINTIMLYKSRFGEANRIYTENDKSDTGYWFDNRFLNLKNLREGGSKIFRTLIKECRKRNDDKEPIGFGDLLKARRDLVEISAFLKDLYETGGTTPPLQCPRSELNLLEYE